MQFDIGISTNRYLPANGTAGFERSSVSGNSRVPWPPPMTTANTRAFPALVNTSDIVLRLLVLPLL